MKFIIRFSVNYQFYFVLVSKNNEVLCTSELYKTKQACLKGIKSVRWNSTFALIVDKTKS